MYGKPTTAKKTILHRQRDITDKIKSIPTKIELEVAKRTGSQVGSRVSPVDRKNIVPIDFVKGNIIKSTNGDRFLYR